MIGGHAVNSADAGVVGATIGGGGYASDDYRVTGDFGTVGGGAANQAGPDVEGSVGFATIGGGWSNTASGDFAATVAGGSENTASGQYSTVAGGRNNAASALWATVAGGVGNTASGVEATVAGGQNNTAAGPDSFAAGTHAKIAPAHHGAFLFADRFFVDFDSVAANEFAVRSTGGARFVTAFFGGGAPAAGVRLAAGGGSWSSISDRNAKANFADVDAREILERLMAMPVGTWSYKSQDPSIRHIGPNAQDFHAAFRVGEDDSYITTVDADGVSLVAIQGLHQLMQERDSQMAAQRQQIAALEERLAALEQAVGVDGGPARRLSRGADVALLLGGLVLVGPMLGVWRTRAGSS
jgi:hypothetical protein